MKISNYITEHQIHIGIAHKRKRDIFKELLSVLVDLDKINQEEKSQIENALVEREKLGSTAIGHGIAIPHARITGLPKPLLVIGMSSEGIDFASLDGEPVYIIFLILSPREEAGVHLKMLATISKLLRDKFLVGKLRKVTEASVFKQIISDQENKTK